MATVFLHCPSCGAYLSASEDLQSVFPLLRCPSKLPDGRICQTFVDRRKQAQRGGIVARTLQFTVEDTKLLKEMAIKWEDA